ncbi:hypothetical protein XELAEV_18027310mg [Xenopus laevis]|uniref:Cytochrome b5 heme-binding domain-containing protein n=1 Tax=Xenopus laevis TaxID=8355 RepID=A0A974CVA3_XENLA|nr:hypothetical protein XELAEV_18027310mg [Xenopus laevis]
MVYNITPYMEYHPGGEEELMKAAGTDGTDLFDQVHRWVNYETMLKECLIGRMALKPVSISKGSVASSEMSRTSSKECHPRYDWFQTESLFTITNICSELVIADHVENILRGEIIIGDYLYLLQSVQKDIEVKVNAKSGKIEITMQKKEPVFWKSLGQPLGGHNSFKKRYMPNTHLFAIKLCLYLMMKLYPNGSITPHLDSMTVGDYISISNPLGIFSTSLIEDVMDVFLVAQA